VKKANKASRIWGVNKELRKHIFKSNEYVVLTNKETGVKSLSISDKSLRDRKASLVPKDIRRQKIYNPMQYNYQMLQNIPIQQPQKQAVEEQPVLEENTEVLEKIEGISGT